MNEYKKNEGYEDMKHNKKVFFENNDKKVHLRNLAKYDMDEAKRNKNYRNVTLLLH